MTQLKSIFAASVIMVSLLSITAFTNAKNGNSHVNGGGTTVEGGEVSTFVFNAVEHEDGSVTGHLNYMIRTSDISIKMDIDCMNINGNRATLSGVVTSVSGKATPPGFIFEGTTCFLYSSG